MKVIVDLKSHHNDTNGFLMEVCRGITNGWSNLPLGIQSAVESASMEFIPGESTVQVTIKVSWNLSAYSGTEEETFNVREFRLRKKGPERVTYGERRFMETVQRLVDTLAKNLKQDAESLIQLLNEGTGK